MHACKGISVTAMDIQYPTSSDTALRDQVAGATGRDPQSGRVGVGGYPGRRMNRSDRRIFGTLFFSNFTSVIGVGIVVPLLPVYAHQLGAGGMAIGLIFAAFSLSRALCMPVFGRLSDRKGRKPFIIAGLLSYALISLAFVMTRDVSQLVAIRFVQGIASAMLIPVVLAYVGDITPQGRKGATMGLFNMSLLFGLSIGPVIGGLISDLLNLQAAFLGMGLLASIGFVLSWQLLPPTVSEHVMSHRKALTHWRRIVCDRTMVALFTVRLAYAACIGIVWSFTPVFAKIEFGLTSTAIGFLVTCGVFVSGLLNPPMGKLADRFNRPALVLAGGLVTCAAIGGYRWVDGFDGLVVCNLLLGIGGGIAMPALMALALEKGEDLKATGTVMSLITMAHSLGMLVGAVSAGAMMQWFELRQVFPLGAVIMATALVTFLILFYTRDY